MQPGDGVLLVPSGATTVKLDFINDLAALFRHELGQLGSAFDPNADVKTLGIMLFNTRYRLIAVRPRRVHISKELRRTIAENEVMNREEKVGLRRLTEKLERGHDVQAHLSTLTARANKKDGLLFDWAIYHFHLGIGPHPTKPGFVERTPPVLLAWVHDDDVYMLDVMDHKVLDAVKWAPKELLEIVLANWPTLLERYRMRGISGLVNEPTSLQHGQLRAAGAFACMQLSDGGVYGPPGGGIMCSRDSSLSVMALNRCMVKVDHWERWVRENAAQKVELARKAGLPVGYHLDFELYIEDSTAYARERASDLRIPLGSLP